MNQDTVESVTPMSDYQHPRELAQQAIQAHYEEKKPVFPPLGRCEIHDESRQAERPAPSLDVDGAIDKATYKVKGE